MPRKGEQKAKAIPVGLPVRDRELLTFDMAADVLGVSKCTIQKAVDEKQLIAVQAPGTFSSKGRRILRASIDHYLAEYYNESNPSLRSSA